MRDPLLMPAAVELAPGSVLAGFRVESLVGRGGMGVVYRATQLSLDRRVALKLIGPELAGEERFRERFLREARLAASLDHPHVLPVYEAGEAEERLFLAMRLVEGASLTELLRGEGRLDPERALLLFGQLARALQAAHEAGLLHRDVKPANVLVAGTGEQEHAYLCDFGLARRLEGTALTGEGAFLGTAAYAAPEQIRGERLDERSDLYALACLLYECLTGGRPYQHEDELALCWAHLHEPVPLPGCVDSALARFDPLFVRALAKDPGERFGSAAELAQAGLAALSSPAAAAAPLAPAAPSTLPRPLSTFLGRERELQEVLELLLDEDVRLLTLTGPGGTGKTRLALRAAEEAAAAFPDGVHWVGLAALRDPALVTETIAQTLGAKGGLAERIGEQRLLLPLDNFEQVIEAAPELSRLLQACPRLTLLVTSRALLRVGGEVEYPVPALAEPEAVALFCARAQLEPSAEIAELCPRLDNLPLAVELAAARTKVLSPAQILSRLGRRLDLFTGARDADPRQHTLRATIEWSYDLLSADEQQLFGRLAVFAGGCMLEAAEEVCDADLDTLQSLVEKNLVRFSKERFWLLETIREYALERLVAAGETATIEWRYARHFVDAVVSAAREAGSYVRSREDFARVSAERENLRRAVDITAERGEASLVAAALGAAWSYWISTGAGREALRWTQAALEHREQLSDDELIHVLFGGSEVMRFTGDLDGAETLKLELLELDRRHGGTAAARRVPAVLADLADIALLRDDVAKARAFAEESVAKGGGPRGSHSLAEVALRGGDIAQAAHLFEKAADAYREIHEINYAFALEGHGEAARRLGDAAKARALFLEAARRFEHLGDQAAAAECLDGLAALAAERGQHVDAAVIAGASERLRAEWGMPSWGRDRPLANLPKDALARGQKLDLGEAIAYADALQ